MISTLSNPLASSRPCWRIDGLMIRYALLCGTGHRFEGWFRSSADFDRQARGGKLSCPVCGAGNVAKQLMTPGVSNADRSDNAPATMVKPDERDARLRRLMREMRDHIVASSEDVGPRFAEEARRIHYDEAAHRSIRGQTTPLEAKALLEEGIDIAPLPVLPDDLM